MGESGVCVVFTVGIVTVLAWIVMALVSPGSLVL